MYSISSPGSRCKELGSTQYLVRLCCLMSSGVGWHIRDKLIETNAEARFSITLRPRKPEGSLGRTAQDGHLDSHTAPELWQRNIC